MTFFTEMAIWTKQEVQLMQGGMLLMALLAGGDYNTVCMCLGVASYKAYSFLPRLASQAVGQQLHSSFRTQALVTLYSMLPSNYQLQSLLYFSSHGKMNCRKNYPLTSLNSLAGIFLVWLTLSTTTFLLFMSSTSM